ncbi:hypothetical protein H696_05563 [Fonticula alba]|uniref:Small ribosomal subunit protein mS35 mitochondrial conserved domain-containing protein n=1 Tax=Fonticula alba TaxID=691883 RepID=A0A058Z118_FONAL|nr:hypothetical protein H696_05563 [Fonticula alba]KCV67831.1 hypothetical protein H696_05563 [Fonticula alba]|eukprot:XP_009497651.1 hypothetical protein H696_05563 [Fonticula alba]
MLRSSSRLLRKVVNSSQVAAKTVSARQTQVLDTPNKRPDGVYINPESFPKVYPEYNVTANDFSLDGLIDLSRDYRFAPSWKRTMFFFDPVTRRMVFRGGAETFVDNDAMWTQAERDLAKARSVDFPILERLVEDYYSPRDMDITVERTSYFDASEKARYPRARRCVMRVRLASLNLHESALHKLKLLAGSRVSIDGHILTVSEDRSATFDENRARCYSMLHRLVKESLNFPAEFTHLELPVLSKKHARALKQQQRKDAYLKHHASRTQLQARMKEVAPDTRAARLRHVSDVFTDLAADIRQAEELAGGPAPMASTLQPVDRSHYMLAGLGGIKAGQNPVATLEEDLSIPGVSGTFDAEALEHPLARETHLPVTQIRRHKAMDPFAAQPVTDLHDPEMERDHDTDPLRFLRPEEVAEDGSAGTDQDQLAELRAKINHLQYLVDLRMSMLTDLVRPEDARVVADTLDMSEADREEAEAQLAKLVAFAQRFPNHEKTPKSLEYAARLLNALFHLSLPKGMEGTEELRAYVHGFYDKIPRTIPAHMVQLILPDWAVHLVGYERQTDANTDEVLTLLQQLYDDSMLLGSLKFTYEQSRFEAMKQDTMVVRDPLGFPVVPFSPLATGAAGIRDAYLRNMGMGPDLRHTDPVYDALYARMTELRASGWPGDFHNDEAPSETVAAQQRSRAKARKSAARSSKEESPSTPKSGGTLPQAPSSVFSSHFTRRS